MSKNKYSLDFEIMVGCAVRYALGRRTYVVGSVTNEVRTMIKSLSTHTLQTILKDIADANMRDELGYKYINKPLWLELRIDIDNELKNRNIRERYEI